MCGRESLPGFTRWFRPVGAAALGLLLSGCLVNAPEELEAQERVPPKFFVLTAAPTVFELLLMDEATSNPEFTVSYTSEDLGEPVTARLYWDWGKREPLSLGVSTEGGHSLEDGAQEMRVVLDRDRLPPQERGCHTVTMVIAHSDNFDQSGSNTPIPADESKADFITWWVLYNSPLNETTLAQCPRPG